ncbi:MAG: hypothetical protein JWM56_1091 [Candidatus Peribacteria bacterium]|nr:hypothetical protein [Candidatus Peribacteria bacterium]
MTHLEDADEDDGSGRDEHLVMAGEGLKFLGEKGLENARKVSEFLRGGIKAEIEKAVRS